MLESNIGRATMSSAAAEIPASHIFDWMQAKSSFTEACLTFSAIAPIAWAAATLVSQFLLRRYCDTWSHMELKLTPNLFPKIYVYVYVYECVCVYSETGTEGKKRFKLTTENDNKMIYQFLSCN